MRRIAAALFGVFTLGWALLALLFAWSELFFIPIGGVIFGLFALVLFRASWIMFQIAGNVRVSGLWSGPRPVPREVDRMRRVAIRDAGENKRVKIVGKLRLGGKKLTAPLSERPCAFYEARVDDGGGNHIASEIDGHDFFVEDESGIALVRVDAATVVVKLDARYQSEGEQATSHQWALLKRHQRMPHGKLHYREGTLTPGERVAVVGTPYREPDPDPHSGAPFREMPFRLVFAARGRDSLFITDDLR